MLPERAVWSNASAWAHHDNGGSRILRQVEGMSLTDNTWHFGANLNAVEPCGAHTIVPGTKTLYQDNNTSMKSILPTTQIGLLTSFLERNNGHSSMNFIRGHLWGGADGVVSLKQAFKCYDKSDGKTPTRQQTHCNWIYILVQENFRGTQIAAGAVYLHCNGFGSRCPLHLH